MYHVHVPDVANSFKLIIVIHDQYPIIMGWMREKTKFKISEVNG